MLTPGFAAPRGAVGEPTSLGAGLWRVLPDRALPGEGKETREMSPGGLCSPERQEIGEEERARSLATSSTHVRGGSAAPAPHGRTRWCCGHSRARPQKPHHRNPLCLGGSPCHPAACRGEKNEQNRTKQTVWRRPEAQTKRKCQRHPAHRLNSGTVKKNASSAGGPKILAQSRISPESWVVD